MSLFSEDFSAARRDPAAAAPGHWYIIALINAAVIPAMVVIAGVIVSLLEQQGISQSPVRLGTQFVVPIPQALVAQSPLIQLTWCCAALLVLSLLLALSSWAHRRGVDRRTQRLLAKLHRELLSQALRRASIEGAIAQRERIAQLIEERLPRLGEGLRSWWLAVPRSLLLVIGGLAVALLVNIPLASLAIIGGLLLWQFHQWLWAKVDEEFTAWELPRARRRLVDLISQAPLLAKTHTGGVADQAFEAELETLLRNAEAGQRARRRHSPLLVIAASLVIVLLVLGLGVNLLAPQSDLSVSSLWVLVLSLVATVTGATRLSRAIAGAVMADEAARPIHQFLKVAGDASPSEQLVGLAGLRERIEIRDVALSVAGGKMILGGVSLQLRPGELVALMGTRPASPLALAELLIGIGRPSQGTIRIDGIEITEIHPRSLAKQVLWIGADGPITDGTLMENLVGERARYQTHDVVTIIQSLGIDSLLTQLEDGQQTVLAPEDARLSGEQRYLIGVARALIHRPPIIVVEEAAPPAEELGGDRALVALRKLADTGSLVIVLPRRLTTLRAADRVVLFSGPQLAGEGKHNGLLQSSDLYRHLNYLLFNPYRGTLGDQSVRRSAG